MRIALILALVVLAPLWYFACLTAGRGGPGHRHEEDRESSVWVDDHRTLVGCLHCRTFRVYYDGALVRDWGNWTGEEYRTAGPASAPTPHTAP